MCPSASPSQARRDTGQCHNAFMTSLVTRYTTPTAMEIQAINVFLEIRKAIKCRGQGERAMRRAIFTFVDMTRAGGRRGLNQHDMDRFCELFTILRKHDLHRHDVSPYADLSSLRPTSLPPKSVRVVALAAGLLSTLRGVSRPIRLVLRCPVHIQGRKDWRKHARHVLEWVLDGAT